MPTQASPLEYFESKITRIVSCIKCKKQTRKETQNSLSLRLQPKTESIKGELAKLIKPGELTEDKADCDHCKQKTS